MNALDRYAEFREQLRTLIGGRRRLPHVPLPEAAGLVKEKGRKSNYQEFNLLRNRWEERRRDLNLDEYSSFIEVSLRAAACPMPLNADVWDGLRCIGKGQKVFTNKGWIPIEKINSGDKVLSYNLATKKWEWKEVTETVSLMRKDLLEIEMENGKLLRLTADHPVLTADGWKLAGNLTKEDEILTYGME